MSLKCLDNFMHYSKRPEYASLETFSFLSGYRTLEQTSKDYSGPVIENFTQPGYQQKYGTVSTNWACTNKCSNQWLLCHKPSGGVCQGTGCAPCPTGPSPTGPSPTGPSPTGPMPMKETFIPTKRFKVKLNSNFRRDHGKLINDSGFFILEDLGRGEYIIQIAKEKPNLDILIANSNLLQEIKV